MNFLSLKWPCLKCELSPKQSIESSNHLSNFSEQNLLKFKRQFAAMFLKSWKHLSKWSLEHQDHLLNHLLFLCSRKWSSLEQNHFTTTQLSNRHDPDFLSADSCPCVAFPFPFFTACETLFTGHTPISAHYNQLVIKKMFSKWKCPSIVFSNSLQLLLLHNAPTVWCNQKHLHAGLTFVIDSRNRHSSVSWDQLQLRSLNVHCWLRMLLRRTMNTSSRITWDWVHVWHNDCMINPCTTPERLLLCLVQCGLSVWMTVINKVNKNMLILHAEASLMSVERVSPQGIFQLWLIATPVIWTDCDQTAAIELDWCMLQP